MRSLLILFVLTAGLPSYADQAEDFRNRILATTVSKNAFFLVKEFKKQLESTLKVHADVYPYNVIAMLNDTLGLERASGNCQERVANFKLSYYDYRDRETFPQKEVSEMLRVFVHVCELKNKEQNKEN